MKKILTGVAVLFSIYILIVILYTVFGLTSCTYGIMKSFHETSYLPDEKISKVALQGYLKEKYNQDFVISENPSIIEKGKKSYRIIYFKSQEDDMDSTKSYRAYITYKSKKNPTPVVESDTYYNTQLEPLLKEYLDSKYNQNATILHLFGQLGSHDGFSSEVPIIQTPEEVEEFIQKYKIDFTYIIFNRTDAEQLKENINSIFSQYSDDYVQIRIISGYSDDIQNEIDNSLKLGEEIKVPTASSSYDETVIKSDIYK
ncbi:hypothetical protein [uncultured Eubacterium sp.]|uniref:hypothetical protein n=1 Tax=uncultured Eubacterium sp. TaxID=165185 RepID=UPI000EBAE881|nr:hypothetical protein [uncultured Eubacterium sp.]HAH17981.1 hypothetical protein [Eubacterium sp.]